jgi:hypothetical protein
MRQVKQVSSNVQANSKFGLIYSRFPCTGRALIRTSGYMITTDCIEHIPPVLQVLKAVGRLASMTGDGGGRLLLKYPSGAKGGWRDLSGVLRQERRVVSAGGP